MKLFVYGSLLSGERQHFRLGRSRLVGAARTEPCYTLVDLGPYPAILEGGGTSVSGEVYEVDESTLASLDAYEGHPETFRRGTVLLAGGETAQGYVAGLARSGRVLPAGDWRLRDAPAGPDVLVGGGMRFLPRRVLGRTGFKATAIGAGDLADPALGLEACVATLKRALDAGLNVVDTAPAYEDGLSEQIVGRAVAGRRAEVFVIDKIDHLDRPVKGQVDASMRRLGSPPDAFVFHGVSRIRDWEALVSSGGGFDDLAREMRAGSCRFMGVSSHHPEVVRAAVLSGRCDVVMFPVGPYVDARYTTEVLQLARRHEVGVVSFKTFGAGMLVADTAGYGRPLDASAATARPRLSVDECVSATLTFDPDVALLGLSTPDEQDAAFLAVANFAPLSPDALADVCRRAELAIRGKGPTWWNPDTT